MHSRSPTWTAFSTGPIPWRSSLLLRAIPAGSLPRRAKHSRSRDWYSTRSIDSARELAWIRSPRCTSVEARRGALASRAKVRHRECITEDHHGDTDDRGELAATGAGPSDEVEG